MQNFLARNKNHYLSVTESTCLFVEKNSNVSKNDPDLTFRFKLRTSISI